MRPLILPLVLACVVVGLALSGQSRLPRARAVFPDGTAVSLEVADTEPVRERGLMFREHLAPNEGMVFVFPEPGYYPFWMKNTLIPLDMIFIGADGRIVNIAERAVPLSTAPIYSSDVAMAVLEVNGGTAARLGIKAGDTVVYGAFGTSGS
jgi:uncharacterized membrane protein (UPF0127 family)